MAIDIKDLKIAGSDDRNIAGLHQRIISQHNVTKDSLSGSNIVSQHELTRSTLSSQHVITKDVIGTELSSAHNHRIDRTNFLSTKIESQHTVTKAAINASGDANLTTTRSQHTDSKTFVSQMISSQNDFMLQNIGSYIGPRLAFVENVDLPSTGSKTLKVILRNYDIAGFDKDADSVPTISLLDASGSPVLSVPVDSNMTHTAVGGYEFSFTVNSTDTPGEFRIRAKVVNDSKNITITKAFNLMDFDNDPIKAKIESAHTSTKTAISSNIDASNSDVKTRIDVQDVTLTAQHNGITSGVVTEHGTTRTHVTTEKDNILSAVDQNFKQIPRIAKLAYHPVFKSVPTDDKLSMVDDNWVAANGATAQSGGALPTDRWDPMYGFVISHPYQDEVFNDSKFQTIGGIELSLKWKTVCSGGNTGRSFWMVKKGAINTSVAFDEALTDGAEATNSKYRISPTYEASNVNETHILNTVLRTSEMDQIPFTIWLAGQVDDGVTTLDAKLSSRIWIDFSFVSEM